MDDEPASGLSAQGVGCAYVAAGLNILLMGLVAFSFSHGPYSSWEQEKWYRYGSLGFLVIGALLPAAVLALGARRSPVMIWVIGYWLVFGLLGFSYYALMSGGGV